MNVKYVFLLLPRICNCIDFRYIPTFQRTKAPPTLELKKLLQL